MIKKMTAILIAALLLAGCSQAELGYMALMSEVSQVKSMHIDGKLDISLNKELAENTPALREGIGCETVDMMAKLGNSAELSYDGDVKITNNIVDANINLYFKPGAAQERQYLCNIILKDNNWYLDTQGIVNIYILAMSLYPEAVSEHDSDFINEITGYDYVLMQSAPEEYFEGSQMSEADAKEMQELVKEIFKGFETGLVRQVDDKYRLELDMQKAIDCMARGTSYLSDNSRFVFDTINKNRLAAEYGGIGDYETFADNLENMEMYALAYKQSFKEELRHSESQLKDYADSYGYAECGKTDGIYRLSSGFEGIYAGAGFCEIRSTVDITPKEVTIAAPAGTVLDMRVTNDAVPYDRYNTVTADGVYEVEVYERAG